MKGSVVDVQPASRLKYCLSPCPACMGRSQRVGNTQVQGAQSRRLRTVGFQWWFNRYQMRLHAACFRLLDSLEGQIVISMWKCNTTHVFLEMQHGVTWPACEDCLVVVSGCLPRWDDRAERLWTLSFQIMDPLYNEPFSLYLEGCSIHHDNRLVLWSLWISGVTSWMVRADRRALSLLDSIINRQYRYIK